MKKDYEELEEIGRGGFGVVYRCRCLATGKEVAVKKIDLKRVADYRVHLEVETLRRLQPHDNIIQFYEQFKDGSTQCIVMEFCKHKSLRDYIKTNGHLSDYSAAYVLRQLIMAVKHIHDHKMMHRDLSSGNVLISDIRNEKLRIKLADFGLATPLREGDVARTMLGTPGYMAPQVFNRQYNQKADVFSLGGLLYLMLIGRDPPRDRHVALNLCDVSREGCDLIRKMMEPDENDRINLEDIKLSDFIRKADEMGLWEGSFKERSREGYRQNSHERLMHNPSGNRTCSPSRVRARSAQPRVNSYKRMTKDSAFESDDIDAKDRRAFSSQSGLCDFDRLTGCSHSVFENNACRKCGYSKSSDRRYDLSRITRGNFHRGRLLRTGVTDDYRNQEPVRSHRILSTLSSTGRSSYDSSGLIWPLPLFRLSPFRLIKKVGRFLFDFEDSVSFEVASKERLMGNYIVSTIVTVTRSRDGEQSLTVYQPATKTTVPDENDPPVQVDRSSRRVYTSLVELENRSERNRCIALSLYRRIIEAVRFVGGRFEKIVFKPTIETTARLMENGDFRLKFSDGRLALQKQECATFSISCNDKIPASLTDEDANTFRSARSDALELESLLETSAFRKIKPFPMYFSNYSLFLSERAGSCKSRDRYNESGDSKSKKLPVSSSAENKHLRSDCDESRIRSNEMRKPLAECNYSKTLIKSDVRVLNDSEYELRGQADKSGRKIITRIVSLSPNSSRSVRISSATADEYIYREHNKETRFRFTDDNFATVPSSARNLLLTLCEKRKKHNCA